LYGLRGRGYNREWHSPKKQCSKAFVTSLKRRFSIRIKGTKMKNNKKHAPMKNVLLVILCLVSYQGFSQTNPNDQITTNNYLLHGKFTAKTGLVDELANILIEASQLVSTAKGCQLYVVSRDKNDPNSVYVTEIWDSKDDHDNSLKI